MRLALPKKYIRPLWRAIIEFDLLSPGDRVLVGFSGGKDSSFLLYALSILRQHAPFPFEVGALTIDLGFETGFPRQELEAFCQRVDVPFYTVHTKISELALGEDRQSACARCSFFRRGTFNAFARAHGFNKVAYAHHYDDAVETFLMSILYSGQIQTFQPKTWLDESQLWVIRPLVYFREKEIRRAGKELGIQPIPSPCPLDGYTKRAEVKELLRQLGRQNRQVFANVAAAMREGTPVERWPRELSKKEIWQKSLDFWRNKS
ncbi:tRNA 2-thiocytidine biosynthesis TtcA family protein [Carboxydocella sp. ULO1]|uniref:tRNA 2-thiocytidine biosynthesis TtcA family protein n=1 Tax=Carboxydocella sp. ULO1 TaxID=1926599 RepID=UPI0009AD44CF|nr:tRNA 2-thiocytidine biosynthesis TtcA family protein [Carboxydocella sp. ULO1]GAW27735.1 tRNA 2-thiocytidine biosynthesis protein TtcA [Carboxydocella sp. ULO1]